MSQTKKYSSNVVKIPFRSVFLSEAGRDEEAVVTATALKLAVDPCAEDKEQGVGREMIFQIRPYFKL